MKLKINENIGNRGKQLLIQAGHDVLTVFEQNLHGATDIEVIKICQLDFSNPIRFKPSE